MIREIVLKALGLSESQYSEIRRLLPGQKIEAIKRFREITNVSLAEAKAAVEAIERGAVPGGGPPVLPGGGNTVALSTAQHAELMELLATSKIEAIKRCRAMTHMGLAEAKDLIDAIERGAQPGGAMPAAPVSVAVGAPPRQQPGASLPSLTAARLAALLPPGSRPPTAAEAATIGALAATRAFAEAGLQISAGWGLDTDEAQKVAVLLSSPGVRPGFLMLAVALGMALCGMIVWMLVRG